MALSESQLNDAEQRLLGALLSRPLLIGAAWLPRPVDYIVQGHEEIALALSECGADASVEALCEVLEARGELEGCGGVEYLEQLEAAASHTSELALKRSAAAIIDASRDRSLSFALTRAATILASDEPRAEVVRGIDAELDRARALLHTGPVIAESQTLDLRALATTPPPERTWFIRDWLGPCPTLFAASGGVGKSLLAQQTATALAIGRSFIGEVERPLRNLVWACEDDADELARRQVSISRQFEIDVAAPADNLILQSRLGVDSMLMVPRQGEMCRTNVFDELRQQANDLDVDVLWLDNVAHLFGGDEVHRGQVTSFISALAGLVTGRPFAVVLLSHVARQVGSEFAGSAAWENAVRMRWYLGTKLPDQKADDTDEIAADVRFLAKRKTNYAQRDYVRFRYVDGAFLADQAPGGALASHLDEQRAEELLVAGFRSLRGMGLLPTDGKSSPDFLPRQVVAKGLAAGYGQKEMTRALDRLMGRGDFIRGPVGQYGNRTPKLGLILQSETSA